MLDRDVVAVAPLRPRTPVIAHLRIARHLKRDIRVRRAVPALAIRHYLGIGPEPERLEFRAKLPGGLKTSVRTVACRPIAMNRARNCAAAPGANSLREILLVAAHVEKLHLRTPEILNDIGARCGNVVAEFRSELRRFDGGRKAGQLFS